MALIWLRVALGCYAVGLIYAIMALTRASDAISKVALHAAYLGMVFQFVSLMEGVVLSGHVALASVHNSESLLGFLVMMGFMVVYLLYSTTSTGIIVFPVVFLLTFVAALGQQPFLVTTSGMRTWWLFAHIATIFTGYAAMFLSFCASLLYLVQEHNLKAKGSAGLLSRLPALEVIDEIGYRSLIFGFPFMTVGLAAGAVVAQNTFGHVDYFDPKILLSILMWLVYLVMLYTRWNAGWRGRRAAYLAAGAFASAVVAWAANYFSSIHRFVQS
ncbi:MAG: cytochrome c biogenesis protein CcsA [Acidobacteriales bacterium]|nr:cytochrome c biogenesis protein CcsA [Terriglobales bacterium]